MERKNYSSGSESHYRGLVDSSGIDGRNGSSGQNGMPGGSGAPGSPGTNATPATHGEAAQQMRVVLKKRDYHGSTHLIAHCLTPSNTPSQQEWLLQGQDMLLLRAKGGDGGHGANGGNGGDGGHGMDGVSSNEHQSGTRGGDGGGGGNGGNGTSGASGGSGGYIEIEVEEDDMELLIPIQWDVRGGIGGKAGANGTGGGGGYGGYGGKGYGSRGLNGASGNAILQAGQYGQPGSARIQVHMKSTRELGARHNFYTRRYFFELLDFQVIDENEDGIYEPGEHVIVRNIRIKNTGKMPTPTQQPLPIRIVGNDWLSSYENEDVYIPPGIPAGETVTVQGDLRARIKYPTTPSSRPFSVKTQVEFHAIIPSLNGRIIRDFSGKHDITLGYPISIDAVRWADSVLPNTRVLVVWKITNRSTRALGKRSDQGRSVQYIFQGDRDITIDSDLAVVGGTGLRNTEDVNYLGPGETCTLKQEIVFHSTAQMYKHHKFNLTLALGRQQSHEWDVVQANDVRIQVGFPYTQQPNSTFLLVVHSGTTAQQITNWQNMMASLKVVYDVWNVSLYGGYNRPIDGSNVLNNYFGKGIIIMGEDFTFFQQDDVRNAADLIPPELGFALATRGTNILFLGNRSASVDKWVNAVMYPQFGSDPSLYKNKRQMVLGLRAAGLHNPGIMVPVSGWRKSKTKGKFEVRAAKSAKLMQTKFPLQRFQIYPDPSNSSAIIVKQSLPVGHRLMICSGMAHSPASLDNLHLVAIASSLPISVRVHLALGTLTQEADFSKGGASGSAIDLLVPETLKLSMIHELELEITRYLADAPWTHRITTAECNLHLKILHEFINAWPREPMDADQANFVSEIFTHLLRKIRLSGFGEHVIRFGYRKTNLRKYLLAMVQGFLDARVTNGPEVLKYIQEQAKNDKIFAETPSKLTTQLQIPAIDLSTRWIDSFHQKNRISDAEDAALHTSEYLFRNSRLNIDNAASQYVLRELVVPYPMEITISHPELLRIS
ncbi:hypothetical protein ABW20_dc0107497 [Dactylellina cionopaga]|nr:hypothetical protein ABW20_dc0107497 [Dactylellina cionopaga]